MKRVLVTGGAGFIGSHVCEVLSLNIMKPVIVDNFSTGREENLKGDTFYAVDVKDKESLRRVFEKHDIFACIHLAAQIDVRFSMSEPRVDARDNIIGTISLLECAEEFGVDRVVFSSSAAVYGQPEEVPLKEESKKEPVSAYGISKLAGEQYVKMFAGSPVVLRYANVYGPRQRADGEAGVASIFCKRATRGRPLFIHGDGEQTRDFIYVRDVARATVSSVVRPAGWAVPPGVYNVGTGKETSLNQLVGEIRKMKPDLNVKHQERAEGDLDRSALSYSKLISTASWRPHVSLFAGLSELYEWHRKRG